MYILLSSVVIDILLTLTGQCSHTMLIIGTSPLYRYTDTDRQTDTSTHTIGGYDYSTSAA